MCNSIHYKVEFIHTSCLMIITKQILKVSVNFFLVMSLTCVAMFTLDR